VARHFIVSVVMSAILSGAALLGGCFDKPAPACAFWCGTQGTCPDGYRCAEDQWCKREDVPEDHECGPGPTQDAAPPDGDLIDAGGIDASPADAGSGDAAPSDDAAPAIDAAPPDANGAGLR
jgi:hypothetical protein